MFLFIQEGGGQTLYGRLGHTRERSGHTWSVGGWRRVFGLDQLGVFAQIEKRKKSEVRSEEGEKLACWHLSY